MRYLLKMRTILFLFPFLLLQACNSSDRPVLAPEAIYAEPGMAIITTLFNTEAQTTSVLYGNALAVAAAHDAVGVHQPGEEYRLVTWRQKGNPLWFGGNINDSIQVVERVRAVALGSAVDMRYDVVMGNMTEAFEKRVQFILTLRGLEFPSVEQN
ncbi:hypothetical protein [Parachryseolinea silvisoli]|uniref:hypothetical protein n=1 Tax=Parachryseolinea silvisoli TaxID=2873601 RepID=UPI002265C0C3|nr:hypothetical protein [Parachryseolinea silvisoli]MCD9015051.1 hypothetical protein [Parachryseolinea silvisoli]